MKKVNHWVVCGVLVLICGNSSLAQSENRKLFIRVSDFIMSQDEASKFSADVISPILTEFARSQNGPEGLRQRVRRFVQMTNRGEISYVAAPAYYPQRSLHVIAKVQEFQSQRFVIVFVPEVIDLRSRLSASEFRYTLLVVFAHEMIHLELEHEKHPDKEATKDEALAWGRTVLEIIRP